MQKQKLLCPVLEFLFCNGARENSEIFSPPSFDEKICYDETMPPIYDDYCDDMYAIKNNDNYETCHHDFNF